MASPPRVFGLILGLTLLVSGGVLAAGQYYRINGYESTTGTMETAEIDTIAVNMSYSPNVMYTYTVDGEQYRSDNVAAGTIIATGNRERLASIIATGENGTTTVYYNPGNPADAHLHPRYNFFPGGLLLVVGVFVMTDTLTPNPRAVRVFTSLFPISTLEQMPGVEVTTIGHAPDDPTAILENQQTWTTGEQAPIRGKAVPAVWFLSCLFMFDITLLYFWTSNWPYGNLSLLTVFAIVGGVMRLAFLHLVE